MSEPVKGWRLIACLKKDEQRETLLLAEENGVRRAVCKRAWGDQAALVEREYQLLSQLPAPWAFDPLLFLQEGDSCCLLREYVDGQTLEELVERQGVLRPADAARLGIKLCAVLAPLHRLSPPVIHRDLKPENVVLTGSGALRLIDFETARTVKPGQETDTVLLGTRNFAAPEQYGYGQTDARTDVYALGRLLCYLLSGDREKTPPPLRGPDRALGKILRRCCSYDPAGRYPGAGELEAALRRYLARRERFPGWPRLAAAAVLVLCLCAASAWGGYVQGRRSVLPDWPEADYSLSWSPFMMEEELGAVMQAVQAEDADKTAKALEELVAALTESRPISQAEPEPGYRELSGEEKAVFYSARQPYEKMADRLAGENRMLIRYRGCYGECAVRFIQDMKDKDRQVWLDENGQEQYSAVFCYLNEGRRDNPDGCLCEVLDGLINALQETGHV